MTTFNDLAGKRVNRFEADAILLGDFSKPQFKTTREQRQKLASAIKEIANAAIKRLVGTDNVVSIDDVKQGDLVGRKELTFLEWFKAEYPDRVVWKLSLSEQHHFIKTARKLFNKGERMNPKQSRTFDALYDRANDFHNNYQLGIYDENFFKSEAEAK